MEHRVGLMRGEEVLGLSGLSFYVIARQEGGVSNCHIARCSYEIDNDFGSGLDRGWLSLVTCYSFLLLTLE